jgi:succinate-semialdehyde dehydrogenase/glutarate-semialdehyde dehydrogenase
MALRSINPATGEVIKEFAELTKPELEAKLELAQTAYESWRVTPLEVRVDHLRNLANVLRENKQELARIITSEVGKTLSAAEAEVEKSASAVDYYADNAKDFLNPKPVSSDASKSYLRYDPIGVVLAVMPWNFPFWQVFRFLAPALAAGNVGVLKHASNVQMSAIAIDEMCEKAGIPKGVFQNLAISSSQVESVIDDPRVRAVTLTGSEYAGSQVAMQAGRNLKKTVLELGGSDPFIVLKDADIDKAVETAVIARLQSNVGQSCIAAKRFIVDKSIEAEFTDKLVKAVNNLVVGDPTDPETNVGPLVNQQGVDDIERQVQESVAGGAKLLTGGERGEGAGYYFIPAVLTNVTKGMPAYDEELFGPVLPIITFETEEEAVFLANDSAYGLGSTIFTADTVRAEKLAEQIEAGQVFINHQVKSDSRLPFGGIKNSGYGRELSSHGMYEFVNIKTVWVK